MRNLASRLGALLILGMAMTVAQAGIAWPHAALQGSDPEHGARLDETPPSAIVTYAEPPTTASVFHVFDGCSSDVASDVTVLNDTIEATIDEGQPGRWRVEWRVISAVDGHLTTDGVSFRVSGEPDCTDVAVDDSADDEPGSQGGLPLVPLAIATVVVVALATVVRVLSTAKRS